MPSIGEALIKQLADRGVDTVFGIPGVHTLELYRGLATSGIRHITPRHEQGAGFMADGYARATGKPGVCFVITGPGVTNILTPMGQARADSIPMLVISSANPKESLGKGRGHLHELPDQLATVATIADQAFDVQDMDDLNAAMDAAFLSFSQQRPGPVYIQLPKDVAGCDAGQTSARLIEGILPKAGIPKLETAVEFLQQSLAPVIIAGGGTRNYNEGLKELAEALDAPVVLTTNARGLMHAHELLVPASPSLNSVRRLIEDADLVLALGTELGRTDFDMYETGTMPACSKLIRVDVDKGQLDRTDAALKIQSDVGEFLNALNQSMLCPKEKATGPTRAADTRKRAFGEIGPKMQEACGFLEILRDEIPNALIVGDSTQPIYAGNLYYDHDRPGGWYNSSSGYGALGYGIPAAIGAAIGVPGSKVVCLSGDGGAQFSLPELMVAKQENLPILFIIWNNHGYQEIETSMQAAEIDVVGCDPKPPQFEHVAASCAMEYYKTNLATDQLRETIRKSMNSTGPILVEIEA